MKNKYWQYIVDGNFSKSQSVDVNFLFNEGNIYISDNHLCALWGWLHECNPDEEYTFIHIDHHNDLKIPNIVDRLKSIGNAKTFDNFLRYREIHMDINEEPFLSYDTYIQIAHYSYPKWFDEILFLTKECNFTETFNECRLNPMKNCKLSDSFIGAKEKKGITYSCQLEKVLENMIQGKFQHKVILNLDIDYFFDCDLHIRDSYWSNEKIDEVAELLNTAMKSGNVRVLTIAMSPECCSEDGKSNNKPSYQPSWGIIERLLRILTDNAKKEFITIMQEKTDINKNSQINENKN